MLLTQSYELGAGFSFSIDLTESALLGHHNYFHQVFELDLIILGVEAFVHADTVKSAKALLGLFDDGHGDDVIGGLLHDLMMQDEPMLVFDHACAQAKFHRYAGGLPLQRPERPTPNEVPS